MDNIKRKLKIINKQLSEDKALFLFLIEEDLVNKRGSEIIRKHIIKHTAGLE